MADTCPETALETAEARCEELEAQLAALEVLTPTERARAALVFDIVSFLSVGGESAAAQKVERVYAGVD